MRNERITPISGQTRSTWLQGMPLVLRLYAWPGFRVDLQALTMILCTGLMCWTLAYQLAPHYHLAIGGHPVTHRREDDAPFLHGFHASEPAQPGRFDWWNMPPGYAYRWTRSAATIRFPGIGGGRWQLSLLASSGRFDAQTPAISRWQAGTTSLPPLWIEATPRVYQILVDADTAGNLQLRMDTEPYLIDSDPRQLGFVLRDVRVAPLVSRVRQPAWGQLGWLVLTLTLVYALVRWLALALRPAFVVGMGLVVLVALLLAWQRLALTLLTPALAALAVSCWALASGAYGAYRLFWYPRIQRHGAQCFRQTTYATVLALVLLAFALRMGGMLHPHALFSDHRFNANRLLEVSLGIVYMTAGLPARAGGGDAPYPPATYLVLAPLQLFTASDIDSRVLTVQSGVALLDSLVIVWVWLLLRQAGLGRRSALFGASLYVLPAPLLGSFSVGEYANIGGQALALPAIVLLAWHGPLGRQRSTPPSEAAIRGYEQLHWWLPLLMIGLLSHMGITLSLVMLLACAWGLGVVSWVQRLWTHGGRGHFFSLKALTWGGVLAGMFVLVFFYSAPPFVPFFLQRLPGAMVSHSATEAVQSVGYTPSLAELVRTLVAPYQRLTHLLSLSGLAGLLLLGQQRHPRHHASSLYALLVAWWLSTLLAAVGLPLLAGASQGVRWPHFLYPALCLGAGPTLALLWQRGRAGRLVALVSVLAITSYGLLIWIIQIRDYMH